MSDERDDEILGRALSRAIETQDASETPFERSRVATRPDGGFRIWQPVSLAAVVLLALAFGAWWSQTPASQPAAAAPSATSALVPTSAPASAVPVTSSAPRTRVDHSVVYFARDGLPPIGLHFVGGGLQTNPEERIASLLTVLARNTDLSKFAVHDQAPPNVHNVFPTSSQIGVVSAASVKIQGDLATVDFSVPQGDWKVRGAAQSLALLQELIYTTTEEPGIDRVLITENGGKPTRIDQFAIDKPLSREDVFGYAAIGPIGSDHAIAEAGVAMPVGQHGSTMQTTTGTGVKMSFQIGTGNGTAPLPAFVAEMVPTRDEFTQFGKYAVIVVIGTDKIPATWTAMQPQIVDTTPLRATLTSTEPSVWVTQLILDDARPWRVYTTQTQIVLEIGGDPRSVSDRIAVNAPEPNALVPGANGAPRTLNIAGSARTFEATVAWRLKDSSQKVLASGHTTASIGTSALWGTFSTQVPVPTGFSGSATLDVYEVSPKDGSEQGLVTIPLVVR